MSHIRDNLMDQEGYSPYCGNDKCSRIERTVFNGEQFEAVCCNWVSQFPKVFIDGYKSKWGIIEFEQRRCNCHDHFTDDNLVPTLKSDGFTEYTCIYCSEMAYTLSELGEEK